MRKLLVLLIALWQVSNISAQDKNFEIMKNLEIFSSAYKELHLDYVDEINPGELIKTALDKMLETLDPYTVYIPEADVEDYKIITTGHYGGLGALVFHRDGYVYISDPYEGFPAQKAGLIPGDKIIKINGQDAHKKNVEEVSTQMKGQAGTSVTLTIEREGVSKPFEVTMIREEVKLKNVQHYEMLNKEVGYILQTGFMQGAAQEVKNAVIDLKSKGMKKLILDLRGNGGGLLNEAVDIVNIFYPQNQEIVSVKGKVIERNMTYKTQQLPLDTEIPVLVLVNRESASASEIVAGSLQDLDRAIIMGQRSFGKGLVQNILPLDYRAQMKITTAKYYIPSGRCVQALDYSHKDDEGIATKIPDSLRTAYKTKGGRTVYDGDGIEPDLELEPQKYSNITISLITKYLIFDYANQYKRNHQNIPPTKEFNITDEIYVDFVNYAKSKDYSYDSQTEDALDKLIKTAKEDGFWNDEFNKQTDKFQEQLKADKNKDFEKYKDEIKNVLKSEIVSRYYYQKGRAEVSLADDPEVKKAIELLNDSAKCKEILTVGNKK